MNVELTEHEAETFRMFQKYRKIIELMIRDNCFGILGGSVTLHFGNNGDLMSIQKNYYSYKRKKDDRH